MNKIVSLTNVAQKNYLSAEEIANDIKQEVENGNADTSNIFTFFHQMNEVFEILKKDARISADTKAKIEKSGKEGESINGFVLRVVTKKTPDYKDCNDPYLHGLTAKEKVIKEEIKTRKDFLDNLQGETVDEKSEGIFVFPPTFFYSSYVTCTKPKVKKAA